MNWQAANNLLCVRLDSMGDVLMTEPALRALKTARPGRRLTLLTSPSGAAIAPLLPEVDEVIVYQAPWMKAPRSTHPEPDLQFIDQLRRRSFDAAFIFTTYTQSALPAALLTFLAGIPLRLAHCRENPYLLLSHRLEELEPDRFVRHEVQRQLDLVASVGVTAADARIRLDVPQTARRGVRSLLQRHGINGQRWLVMHVGASAPSRRYPPESFAAVLRSLEACGVRVLLTGSEEDMRLVDAVQTAAGGQGISLAGVLDLPQLAALIECAPLLISNNTGPVHIAAAVGTPVVVLYALTNPQHTPWRVPNRVLSYQVPCRNCFKSVCPLGHNDCLRRIQPQEVVAAALDLLSPAGSTKRQSGHSWQDEATLGRR